MVLSLCTMESYVPFIHHLSEIALHYKRTGGIPACYRNSYSSKIPTAGITEPSLICGGDSKENDELSKPGSGPFSCCGLTFLYPAHYKSHLKTKSHLSNSMSICSFCGQCFENRRDQLVHQRSKHSRSDKPVCSTCGKTFVTRNGLLEHVKYLHIKLKLYKCDHCSYQAWAKGYLVQHMKRKHFILSRSQLFSCDQCSYQAVRNADLQKHIKTHLKEPKAKMEPVACCGRVYKCPSTLARHKIHCALTKMVKCHMCQERFSSADALELHRNKIHQFSEGKWNCMICDKAFATNGILSIHINTVHIKSTVYSCSKCQLSYTRKDLLQRHWNEHHQDSAESFKCDVCGRLYLRKEVLVEHMKIHMNGYFGCSVCGRSYASLDQLEDHAAVHRPCQICGVTFICKLKRESHMRQHLLRSNVVTTKPKRRVPNYGKAQKQGIRTTLKELPPNS